MPFVVLISHHGGMIDVKEVRRKRNKKRVYACTGGVLIVVVGVLATLLLAAFMMWYAEFSDPSNIKRAEQARNHWPRCLQPEIVDRDGLYQQCEADRFWGQESFKMVAARRAAQKIGAALPVLLSILVTALIIVVLLTWLAAKTCSAANDARKQESDLMRMVLAANMASRDMGDRYVMCMPAPTTARKQGVKTMSADDLEPFADVPTEFTGNSFSLSQPSYRGRF